MPFPISELSPADYVATRLHSLSAAMSRPNWSDTVDETLDVAEEIFTFLVGADRAEPEAEYVDCPAPGPFADGVCAFPDCECEEGGDCEVCLPGRAFDGEPDLNDVIYKIDPVDMPLDFVAAAERYHAEQAEKEEVEDDRRGPMDGWIEAAKAYAKADAAFYEAAGNFDDITTFLGSGVYVMDSEGEVGYFRPTRDIEMVAVKLTDEAAQADIEGEQEFEDDLWFGG